MKTRTYNRTSILFTVLNLIKNNMSQAQILAQTGMPKSTLSEYLKSLTKKQLIKLSFRTNVKYYKLTEIGELIIANKGMVKSELPTELIKFRHHNLIFKFPILRKPENFEKELQNKGWVITKRNKYLSRRQTIAEEGVYEFTSKNLLYKPTPIPANTIDEAISIGLQKCAYVQDKLESAFTGVRFGIPTFEITRQHLALESKEFANSIDGKVFARNDMFQVDASLGAPELETHRSKFAEEDMRKFIDLAKEFIQNDFTFNKIETMQDNMSKTAECVYEISKKLTEINTKLIASKENENEKDYR
jgi:predicted transcriptional regulator